MPPAGPLSVATLAERMRARFIESPDLHLTEAQACHLFHLDAVVGASILAALCDLGFLVEDQSGRFRKA